MLNRDVAQLGGSLVALVTPFLDDSIDERALALLCERQIDCGTRALVVCGSTGEAATLASHEFCRVVATAVEAADGRVPVIAGINAISTEVAAILAMAAVQHGAKALLCAPPAYVKPSQDGIAAHIRSIAHAAGVPVMLYDVPSRTGVAIADATIARLFERGEMWALKDATADLSRPPRLRALCGDGLLQFTGDDATAVAHRAMGGCGCVSVTANLVPRLCTLLHEAWDASSPTVGPLRDLLAPLHDALFVESNPIPIKAALARLDLCRARLRLPLTTATSATQERLTAVMGQIMLEEGALSRRLRIARSR